MSKDLTNVRKSLAQANSNVKQGKSVAAVQAAQDGLVALSGPLLKNERTEIVELLSDALMYISTDPVVRNIFPLQLQYTPGEEQSLNTTLRDLYNSLSDHVVEQAEKAKKEREEAKIERLSRAIAELGISPMKAQASFKALVRDYPNDAQLLGDIGEGLLRAGLFEEAVTYLTEALDMKPDMLPFYNVIGIALRKLQRFPIAETYYLRASQYLRHDPNLYFNIGRLYVDWKKWEKARNAALVALKLSPDFAEAKKLLNHAENKLKE